MSLMRHNCCAGGALFRRQVGPAAQPAPREALQGARVAAAAGGSQQHFFFNQRVVGLWWLAWWREALQGVRVAAAAGGWGAEYWHVYKQSLAMFWLRFGGGWFGCEKCYKVPLSRRCCRWVQNHICFVNLRLICSGCKQCCKVRKSGRCCRCGGLYQRCCLTPVSPDIA